MVATISSYLVTSAFPTQEPPGKLKFQAMKQNNQYLAIVVDAFLTNGRHYETPPLPTINYMNILFNSNSYPFIMPIILA